MAAETAIKKGNRYPALESTLFEAGAPINFKTPLKAVGVKLRIKKVGGAAEEKTAEFVNEGQAGIVRYKWSKADGEGSGPIAAEGEYEYEWIIEWEAGVIENFPSKGFKTYEVVSQI